MIPGYEQILALIFLLLTAIAGVGTAQKGMMSSPSKIISQPMSR